VTTRTVEVDRSPAVAEMTLERDQTVKTLASINTIRLQIKRYFSLIKKVYTLSPRCGSDTVDLEHFVTGVMSRGKILTKFERHRANASAFRRHATGRGALYTLRVRMLFYCRSVATFRYSLRTFRETILH